VRWWYPIRNCVSWLCRCLLVIEELGRTGRTAECAAIICIDASGDETAFGGLSLRIIFRKRHSEYLFSNKFLIYL